MNAIPRPEELAFGFENFELVPARRLLLRDGRAIKVGSRAFDVLVALVERAGNVVIKHELVTRVWANLIVEDTNLRVHIASLRRLLGDDGVNRRYIVHVARQGYIFVCPLRFATGMPSESGPISLDLQYDPLFRAGLSTRTGH